TYTPTNTALAREECCAKVLLLHKIERGRPMFDPSGEIGVEQDIDAVVDVLLSGHLHGKRAAHAALRAFGCDQIARGERRLRSARAIGQRARDGTGPLAERDRKSTRLNSS